MNASVKLVYDNEIRRVSVPSSISFASFCELIRSIIPQFSPDKHLISYIDEEGDHVVVNSTVELSGALCASIVRFNILEREQVPEKLLQTSVAPRTTPVVPKTSSNVNNNNNEFVNLEESLQQVMNKIALLAKNAEGAIPMIQNAVEPAFQSAKNFSAEQFSGLMASLKDIKDPAVQQLTTLLRNVSLKLEGNDAEVHQAWCNRCSNQIIGVRYKCGNCADYDLCEACELLRSHDSQHVFVKLYRPTEFKEVKVLLPNFYPKEEVKVEKPQIPQPSPPKSVVEIPEPKQPAPSKPIVVPAPSKPIDIPPKKQEQQSPPKKVVFVEEEKEAINAQFEGDKTVSDGTVFAPNTSFVKIWMMKNNGTQKWPENSKMVLISGNPLGTKGEIPIKSINPEEEVDICVDMVAPASPGRYISHWRLCTPEGKRFGHRIWVDVMVENPKVPPKPKEEEQYATQLLTLTDLGFGNKVLNIEYLKKFNGDLVQVVSALLETA